MLLELNILQQRLSVLLHANVILDLISRSLYWQSEVVHVQGAPNSDLPEVTAIIDGVASGRSATNPLSILGHKANFGHTVSGAGILAILVACAVLHNRQVPGQMNLQVPARKLRESETILLPRVTTKISKGEVGSMVGTISGTSASGDNVHLGMLHSPQHTSIAFKPSRVQLLDTTELDVHATDPQITCDVLIIGAGATGVFLARDLASSGKTVALVETSSTIGGVWRDNNYFGLFLHQYGVRNAPVATELISVCRLHIDVPL